VTAGEYLARLPPGQRLSGFVLLLLRMWKREHEQETRELERWTAEGGR
jgi:hypothetical protein